MDNYNIQRNKSKLSEEDIAKGQDFDAFMKAYGAKKTSFFKSGKFYSIAVAAALVLVAGTWYLMKDASHDHPGDTEAALTEEIQSFLQPALAESSLPDTTYSVASETGGTYLSSHGTVIHVPGNAFRDSTGKIATGNVELRFREFHDPASIFLAGIPMTYDSAGSRFHFESAGMFEILAYQNGKPLYTNPDSLIRIALASNTAVDKFNVYYLDTTARNWRYIKKDDPYTFLPVTTEEEKKNQPAAPVPPRLADNKKPSFAIQFDPAEFPELTAYKGVRFEVDESRTPYKKEDSKVKWEDVLIRRNRDGETFTITFSKEDRSVSYVTVPVVAEKDLASAKADWERRNKEYQEMLKDRSAKEKELSDVRFAQMEEKDRHRIFVNDSLAARAAAMRMTANLQNATESMIMREFIVSDFGIWNSDCPSSLPEGMMMFAKLIDGRNGKELQADKIYLVEKGRNALFTYFAGDIKEFRFDPDAENMVWALTKDGKIAVVSADDFKNAAGRSKDELRLNFAVNDAPVKSPAEARRLLEF